jgi:hypothetical protein
VSLLVGLCACATPAVQHPEIVARLGAVKKVGIMPVQAQVTRIVFTGENESLEDKAEIARYSVAQALEQTVRGNEFDAAVVPLDDAAFEADPELRFRVTQVQQAADLAMAAAFQAGSRPSSDELSGALAVLPEVNDLASRVDAEALLFARYSGWEKSGGEIAKDVMVSIVVFAATLGTLFMWRPTNGAGVAVCLIDASTGELLYAHRTGGEGYQADPYQLTLNALEQFKRQGAAPPPAR